MTAHSTMSGFEAQDAVLPAARPPPGWRLQARCVTISCGASASIDPAPWLAQNLAGSRLERLETRLRCVCGARRARLEIAPDDGAPNSSGAGVYVFC